MSFRRATCPELERRVQTNWAVRCPILWRDRRKLGRVAVNDVAARRWCGHHVRHKAIKWLALTDRPVDRPRNCLAQLNASLDRDDLESIRTSVIRGRPLGDKRWVPKIADRLALGFTLRDRGRPRKKRHE